MGGEVARKFQICQEEEAYRIARRASLTFVLFGEVMAGLGE